LIRATVDTNIFISALLFGGVPGRFLALALAGSVRLVTSPALLDELDEKLRLKFEWSPAKAAQARRELETLCDLVSTTAFLSVVKDDPDDDRVLECAIAGSADVIISGDRHLLDLRSFQGIQILTVRRLMDQIGPAA
jgi:putative PIN family toxin of toxin-antitoxin system